MIELVTDLPEDVIGVRLSGKVDANEYKNVIDPAIEAARAKSGKVNALVILEPSVDYTLGASWQDMKLGMSHPFSWNRVAVLADDMHWTRLVPVLSVIMPGEFKRFRLDEEKAAKDWVAGPSAV